VELLLLKNVGSYQGIASVMPNADHRNSVAPSGASIAADPRFEKISA
jgi:hypothetical protein